MDSFKKGGYELSSNTKIGPSTWPLYLIWGRKQETNGDKLDFHFQIIRNMWWCFYGLSAAKFFVHMFRRQLWKWFLNWCTIYAFCNDFSAPPQLTQTRCLKWYLRNGCIDWHVCVYTFKFWNFTMKFLESKKLPVTKLFVDIFIKHCDITVKIDSYLCIYSLTLPQMTQMHMFQNCIYIDLPVWYTLEKVLRSLSWHKCILRINLQKTPTNASFCHSCFSC